MRFLRNSGRELGSTPAVWLYHAQAHQVGCVENRSTFYEKQLDGVRGFAARTLEKKLRLVLRNVEDSQRMLRMAREERDAALRQVENLEARHWA